MSESTFGDDAKVRKGKRSFFAFSLRTFLFAVTVLAIWFAAATNKAKKQKKAVEALSSFESTIYYEHNFDLNERRVPDGDTKPPGPEWLRQIVGDDLFTSVNYVRIVSRTDRPVTDEALAALRVHLESLPRLKSLKLVFADDVTDIGIAELAGLKSLEELGIKCPHVTSDGLARLTSLRRLRQLSLGDGIGNRGLEYLQQFPELEKLSLTNSQVTDDGLAWLIRCPELRYLTLQRNEYVSDAGVQHVRGMRSLQTLLLVGDNFTNKSLEALAGHLAIRRLKVWESSVTDAGLEHLQQLPKLNYLSLNHNQITDAGMKSLAQIKQLERLELCHTEVGDQGLEELRPLHNLRVLHLLSTKVTGRAPTRAKQLLPKCITAF